MLASTETPVAKLLEYRAAIHAKLEALRPFSAASTLENAFEFALFPGGKRYRPILALACGELFAKRNNGMLVIAASIELLHTASVVLDDLPAMDNACSRRGKPSLHKLYTPHLAVLCGHGMVSQALYLPTQADIPDLACRRIVAELSRCIGPHGMAAGQADDLAGIETAVHGDALRVAAWKTGFLFAAAGYCGAIAGGASEEEAQTLRAMGMHLGVAYQIADDLQDAKVEDDPTRSVNVAVLLGEKGARDALAREMAKANSLLRQAGKSAILTRLIEAIGAHV